MIIGGTSFALGVLAVLGLWHAPLPAVGEEAGTGLEARAQHDVEIPEKARAVLAEIQERRGEPPPGYVGRRTFGNQERRLPRGNYREYDVNPKTRG